MKKSMLLLFLIMLSLQVFAQDTDFSQRYKKVNTTGMIVLGSWSLANVGLGLSQLNNADPTRRYFYQMNAAWCGVNMIIAGFGYLGTQNGLEGSFAEALGQQTTMTKILLTNAALDLGYMAGGFYLIERSKNVTNNPERLRGFGQGIILQGAFLFVFDVVMHQLNMNNQNEMLDMVQLGITSAGMGLSITF